MSAVLPYLEQKPSERGKGDVIDEVVVHEEDLLMGLGRGPEEALNPLAKPHTELTRLLWARQRVAAALVGAKFKLDVENGTLMVAVEPAVKRDTVPWSFSGSPLRRFSLFSTNSKMECPTWDLPSGVAQLGGSCPGAKFAQSTVPQAVMQTIDEPSSPSYGQLIEDDPRSRSDLAFLIKEVEQDKKHLKASDRTGPHVNLQTTVCTRCVAGDTLVMVRGEGLKRIGDLVGRENIEVWSGFGWRKTHAVMTKLSETVEVRFNGGRALRCTPDHPIMTTDGEVQAQDLVVGEHQVLPIMPDEPSFPARATLPTVQLDEQHFNERRGELPTEWSRELGVWLGYLMGDGWFAESQKHPTLGLCGATHDIGDLERLADIVAPWAGGRAEVAVVESGGSGEVLSTGDVARVYWRRKSMVAFVRALGFTKQGELEVPAAVWGATQDGVAGFLSGLFSTDGSVARWPKRVAVSFANTSKRLCEEVQQLLFAFGIRSNICEYTSNAKRGFKQMWKVDIVAHESVQRFERYIGFFNARKAASLREGLAEVGERSTLKRPLTVEAVTPGETMEPVYDLINVGDEHQFIANGIPVHNCYASGGKYGEAVVQFSEVARLALINAMLKTSELEERLVNLIVDALETTKMAWNKADVARHDIRPVRVHSSGDFYSQKYALMWLKVARRLHENAQRGDAGYKPIVLWAPTRTHVLPGWNKFWVEQRVLWEKSKGAEGIPPNFVIRPSAYSVGDPAPYIKRESPTGSKGTSVLFEGDTRERLVRGLKGDGTKFHWQCGVYALDKGSKTCLLSTAPDGEKGCRVCWKFPKLAVNYVAH